MNKEPLFKTRGDIYAGETKTRVELSSVQGHLELLVDEREAPDIYNASEGDLFELGPFQVHLMSTPYCPCRKGPFSRVQIREWQRFS